MLLVVRDVTQARQLAAMRRDFVANASHELKTPVASIRATAETLRAGAIDDPTAAHRFTDQLEREAIRLSHILADLLDLSRLETGSDGDERRPAGPRRGRGGQPARGVARTIEACSSGHRPPTCRRCRGSARDLALLVRNLVDNAIRYTQPGGEVDVRVLGEDGLVVASRATTRGSGSHSAICPASSSASTASTKPVRARPVARDWGSSIVKHVCENHGGTVTVASELGQGSTFEVRLPATAAASTP